MGAERRQLASSACESYAHHRAPAARFGVIRLASRTPFAFRLHYATTLRLLNDKTRRLFVRVAIRATSDAVRPRLAATTSRYFVLGTTTAEGSSQDFGPLRVACYACTAALEGAERSALMASLRLSPTLDDARSGQTTRCTSSRHPDRHHPAFRRVIVQAPLHHSLRPCAR